MGHVFYSDARWARPAIAAAVLVVVTCRTDDADPHAGRSPGEPMNAPPSPGAVEPPTSPPPPTPMPSGPEAGNTAGGMAAASGTGQPGQSPPAATLTIEVPNVAPGDEDTKCSQVRLSNTSPLNVVRLHNRLTAGSHHFILTAMRDASVAEKPLERCLGFGGAVTGAPLSITQAHDDDVHLPDGVGYRLNAGQVMHLELHYINTTSQTLDIAATAELFAAEPGAQIQEGAVLLFGTANIAVPPHDMRQTPPVFLTPPAGTDGIKFYAITGHTHRFGTSVTVSLATQSTAPGTRLYAPVPFDWESPETKQLSPHVSVPPGGGFLLQCAWNNTGNTPLAWGESATAEMCFFWAYYYPRKNVFSIVVDNLPPELLQVLLPVAGLGSSP